MWPWRIVWRSPTTIYLSDELRFSLTKRPDPRGAFVFSVLNQACGFSTPRPVLPSKVPLQFRLHFSAGAVVFMTWQPRALYPRPPESCNPSGRCGGQAIRRSCAHAQSVASCAGPGNCATCITKYARQSLSALINRRPRNKGLTFDISRLLSRAVHAASAILSYRFPVGKKLRSVGGIRATLPKGTVVIA
jgi:hypothetical protein